MYFCALTLHETLCFVGDNFCSYLCSDGSLWVSGQTYCGELGLDHTKTSVTTATKNDFFEIRGLKIRDVECGNGGHHQIILTTKGELYGVGRNSKYELGFADKSNRSTFTKMTYFELGFEEKHIQKVACAQTYSTFLIDDGRVFVCGTSTDGGLGFGSKITVCPFICIINALEGTRMTQICCGQYHTLSIDEEGHVWSWGYNANGELGQGHKNNNKALPKPIPYFIENNISTVQISCGAFHSLSIDSNHHVYSWGYNNCKYPTPNLVSGLQDFEILDIKAGFNHSVAMTKEYEFYIWGHNGHYQCLTDNKSIMIPTKFDPKSSPQISNDIILSIWSGHFVTNVIIARNPKKKIQELAVLCEQTQQLITTFRASVEAKTQEIVSLRNRIQIQVKELQRDIVDRKSVTERMRKELIKSRKELDDKEKEIVIERERRKSEAKVKDKQIENLKEILSPYTLGPAIHQNKSFDEKQDQNKVKEKEMVHGDGALYNKHYQIISEWNVLTEKLKELAGPLKEGNDDLKYSAGKPGILSADKLLSEYQHSYRLIHQQQTRL